MDYDGFIHIVQQDAGVPRDQAERAVKATLSTLAERLSGGEARDIASQLPSELRRLLEDGENAQPFALEEFLRRIAEREGVDPEAAARHARAVFATLGQTVSHDEIYDMASELPKDFQPLINAAELAPAPPKSRTTGALSYGDFLERVARRARLQPHEAASAIAAVLEALADRISGGQVDDLITRLPTALEPPLRRGKAQSNAAARPLSLEEFVEGIAEREGVTPAEAKQHSRAVLATLREAVGEKEFDDVKAQLPKDYAALLSPAGG